MDIATFNVNSVRARLEALCGWLAEARPDVVCLQETKVEDAAFPREPLEALGYHVAVHGQRTWNGVAILSRTPLEAVAPGIDGFDDPQARVLQARTAGLRVLCLYVPNGAEVDTEKYVYKLRWLDALRGALDQGFDPTEPLVVAGDFNICPDDRDVWDPDAWRDRILCSVPERERFQGLLAWGLQDAVRLQTQDAGFYTFWDYRAGAFRRRWGLRIDHVLLTAPLAARCAAVRVETALRKAPSPSDHAPLVVTLDRS